MKTSIQIGLIGDFNPSVLAHQAISRTFEMAKDALGFEVAAEWLATDKIKADTSLANFDGLWCVPATPYRSMAGALRAITFARCQSRPFLGTCGGFQHAIIEYARSVLGWSDAEHAETATDASRLIIVPLTCALVEATGTVFFRAGSRVAEAYGSLESIEGYHCSYGINTEFREQLFAGALHITAEDAAGDVRAVELDGHPFFAATLFQPERLALNGRFPPLAAAFIRAAGEFREAARR